MVSGLICKSFIHKQFLHKNVVRTMSAPVLKFSFRYDPKTDMWTAVASMSISRDAVGVCLLGDKLYAVGGYDGQTYLNTVEAYDPQTNEWTQVWHFIFHYYTSLFLLKQFVW